MNLQPKPFTQLSLAQLSFPDQARFAEMVRVVPERDCVAHADIEDALRSIARRFDRLPLKDRALDLYTNNRIAILGNRETVRVPKILPAWRARSGASPAGQVMAFANAVPWVPASGAGDMDVRRLFGLLSAGACLVDSFDSFPKVSASGTFARAGAAVYSRMMHKVADRIAGIGLDRMRSDQVKYLFAKFFLIGVLLRPAGETSDALAAGCTAGTSRQALAEFEAAAARKAGAADQAALYSGGWVGLVDALGGAAPWSARITARGFLQTYVTLFDTFSLFAAEDVGFFMAVLAVHQAQAEFVPSFSFDPVYGREGDEAVDEFARLVR